MESSLVMHLISALLVHGGEMTRQQSDSMLQRRQRQESVSSFSLPRHAKYMLFNGKEVTAIQLPLLKPSPVILEQCQLVAVALDSEAELQGLIKRIADSLSLQSLIHDYLCLYSLTIDGFGSIQNGDLPSIDAYKDWKADELRDIHNAMDSYSRRLAYSSDSPWTLTESRIVVLTVVEAEGLLPKDSGGLNNPYCVVHYRDMVTASNIIPHSLDPHWSFAVPLCLAPNDEQIAISVWTRPSKPVDAKDAFLGVYVLTANDLIGYIGQDDPVKLDLHKRSSKSHVKGFLRVSVRQAVENASDMVSPADLYSRCFRVLPPDTQKAFSDACYLLMRFECAKNPPGAVFKPSAALKDILATLRKVWRIRGCYYQLTLLDVFSTLFQNGLVVPESLHSEAFVSCLAAFKERSLLTCEESQKFETVTKTLFKFFEDELVSFFNKQQHRLSASKESLHEPPRMSAKQIEIIANMMADLAQLHHMDVFLATLGFKHNASISHFAQSLLVKSLESRYHGLLALAHADDDANKLPLIKLIQLVHDELQTYKTHYDVLLFDCIHIPSLGCTALFVPVSAQLELFAQSYVATKHDMSDIFDLYAGVRQLQRTCESIDFRLADKVPMARWFKTFVKEWLIKSETKIREWVTNAIELDKWQRLSEDVLYSTSIIDVFTSFQQQLDFVRAFDWPNEDESQLFMTRLIQEICEGIAKYVSILSAQLTREFGALKAAAASSKSNTVKNLLSAVPTTKVLRRGKSGNLPNIKLKMPKMRRASKLPTQPCVVSPECCVRLCNIQALYAQFQKLLKTVPTRNEQSNPTVASTHLFYGDPRYVIRLTIIRGHKLLPTRPWMTSISCRIVSGLGRELGRTATVAQSVSPVWNEPVYAIMTEKEISGGLTFKLMHHIQGKSEALYAVSNLQVQGLKGLLDMDQELETMIPFESYGCLVIRIQMSHNEENAFLDDMMRRLLDRAQEQAVAGFVEQICAGLYDIVHPISVSFKQRGLQSIMHGKTMFSDTSLDADKVEEEVEPFFEYLNANMEVVMGNLEEDMAFRIVSGIWTRVLNLCFGLIVPALDDDSKDKNAWDAKRLKFFKIFVEVITIIFMHCFFLTSKEF